MGTANRHDPSHGLDSVSRREFLRLMGASMAMAGLASCALEKPDKIVPYAAKQPEDLIPGEPLFYATSFPHSGYAWPVHAESHMGRPTKIEGNPNHPASMGKAGLLSQASVLGLYDPDRAQVVRHLGQIDTWSNCAEAIRAVSTSQKAKRGEGIRILTETVTSPTLADQLSRILENWPAAKWIQYEPVSRENVYEGARLAFGESVDTHYHIDRADVIVALDADFLVSGPAALRYAREFASRRRVTPERADMNRLYVAESMPSSTGSAADHRLPVRSCDIESLALAIASALGIEGVQAPAQDIGASQVRWVAAAARDLLAHKGHSIVIPGDNQSPEVHALAHAINAALGNDGVSVSHTDPVVAQPGSQLAALRELSADLAAGKVELLLILGGNPVYTAPADLRMGTLISRAALCVQLSPYEDETTEFCHWHIPESHYLESWGDVRAADGTVSLIQPLIAPLYESRTAIEVLAVFTDKSNATSYDTVRAHWNRQPPAPDFDRTWEKSLHDGYIAGTQMTPRSVTLRPGLTHRAAPHVAGTELVFRPDPSVYDGRFANNAWLQELPKPFTKLTWDNAVLMSPAMAGSLHLENEDVVELRYKGRSVAGPVLVVPGHAPDSITLHLGYGRSHAGRVGNGLGFNAYALRTTDAPSYDTGVEVRKTSKRYRLAWTQHERRMEGRKPVRTATLDQYKKNPRFANENEDAGGGSLYPPYQYDGYAWGMAIDPGACIACNACVVACQAENNIAVVGKDQVLRSRIMHWLRIDQYIEGDTARPTFLNQPLPCMQCELAPCEAVCPVGATSHSDEGLNDMTYNRCVGTRFCQNNCPYKVRRFNFYQFANWKSQTAKLVRNPDVSVRERGVMEKCTYCVQRINQARITAEKENRTVRDGEMMTACQATCPTSAIVFGNVNDPESRVSKLKAQARNYTLLAELNTKPRTSYQVVVRNPDSELEKSDAG